MPNKKVTTEQTEPYQKKIKAKHRRMKVRLIGKGKGPKIAPYNKNPSMARSKSAPPGFGALGEVKETDPVINGLAKLIVNAKSDDDFSAIQNHYFPMVNPDPQELAKAIVDVFIEDILEFDLGVWRHSANVVGALDVRYADYAIQEHLVQLEEDWDKLKRMTKGDPDGFSIEEFKEIYKESYEGAIHVIKQRIQAHMAAKSPVAIRRRKRMKEIVRECVREVYKENGVILTEEQLDEALPRWMQKAGAYAGIGAALAGGVPSTAMAGPSDSGVQTTQQVTSPAQEQRDFYNKYINTGTSSPFYDNAEGFGLGYNVSDSDAKNYALSFKLDTNGNPIADSYKATAIVGDGQSENQDLTQAHERQLQEIVESIDWASEYPAIVEAASEYSALTIGPLEWRGEVQVSGRDVSF